MEDWSALGCADPVPGDPEAVGALAGRLGRTAAIISEQATRLRAVADDGCWEGEAADNFREHHRKLPPRLDMVEQRYRAVARSLRAYQKGLFNAQAQARLALQKARTAQQDLGFARRGIDEMERHDADERSRSQAWNAAHPEGPAMEPLPWTGPQWDREARAAEETLAEAHRMLDAAIRTRDEAAGSAACDIRVAMDDELKNEGGLRAFVKRAATDLADALPLEGLATVLSVAGAVLAVAALAFPVLAPFALGVALAALLVDSVLVAAGRKGWGTLALDVAGVVSFGLGRVAITGARAARSAAAANRLTRIARASPRGMKAWSASNRRGAFQVTGNAARKSLRRQLKTVRNQYPAQVTPREVLRQARADLARDAGAFVRHPVRSLASGPGSVLSNLGGRVTAPRVVDPSVVENLSPMGTRLVRIAYGTEAVAAGVDVAENVVDARVDPGEAAERRGRQVAPAPVA